MNPIFLTMAFNLLGGIGIFLLGMRYMSDGLQSISGNALKKMIDYATKNKYMATFIGIIVTSIIQSSSATTVITVGFVNSGIMQLSQALGVILGSNIGTTVTAWILVINLGKFGLPIVGFFALIYLFIKNERFQFVSMAIMGIGMILFGLDLMSNGFRPLRTMPEINQYFLMVKATSYFGVLGCAFVGCILTMLLQSSSAMIGITVALVGEGLISMEAGAALVLGENIGTTITAVMASFGASTNAKRAAYFHVLFNTLGALWTTAAFTFFIVIIKQAMYYAFGISNFDETIRDAQGHDIYQNRQILVTTTHSMFNILNVILFLPFLGYFNQFLVWAIKDKKVKRKLLTRLEFKMGDSPIMQFEQSRFEIEKMGDHTKSMLANLTKFFKADAAERKTISKEIFEREDILDVVKKEITTFITHVVQQPLSSEIAVQVREQMTIVDEFETISDYITQILKLQLKLEEGGMSLDEQQIKDVIDLCEKIQHCFDWVLTPGRDMSDKERALKVSSEGKLLVLQIKNLRSLHWEKVAAETLDPLLITSYSDMIIAFRKVVSHLVTIADTMAQVE